MEQMRSLTVVLAVLVLAFATACSGGSDKPEPVPSGFKRYSADGYAFAYPEAWTVEQGKNAEGRPVVWVRNPADQRTVLQVGALAKPELSFDDQLGQYRAASLLTGREIRGDAAVKLRGAERAHRFDALYIAELADGKGEKLEITDLYVQTENDVLLDFTMTSSEGGAAAARLPEVFDSFQLKGK